MLYPKFSASYPPSKRNVKNSHESGSVKPGGHVSKNDRWYEVCRRSSENLGGAAKTTTPRGQSLHTIGPLWLPGHTTILCIPRWIDHLFFGASRAIVVVSSAHVCTFSQNFQPLALTAFVACSTCSANHFSTTAQTIYTVTH